MENQPALIEVPTNTAPAIPPGFYKNKPRPNYSSAEVVAIVANKLMPEILGWGKWNEESELQQAEVADQLLEVLNGSRDGYEMAKELDNRHYWDCDSELVDILDGADFYGAAKTAIKEWISDNAITPAFEVGRQVSVKERRNSDMLPGIIRDIRDDGTYCVRVPLLGHVEKGNGTQGIILPWEDVEAWNGAESV